MKNPIEPNLKTEWFPLLMIILSGIAAAYFSQTLPGDLVVAFSRDGQSNQAISWTLIAYIWPILISLVYLMFLFFPYIKINHKESSVLKEQWHRAKELVLSFFFILQVLGMMVLSGNDKALTWALPILFSLFLISASPTMIKVSEYRKKHPLKYK
jgi:uncharacterized membrane protein